MILDGFQPGKDEQKRIADGHTDFQGDATGAAEISHLRLTRVKPERKANNEIKGYQKTDQT